MVNAVELDPLKSTPPSICAPRRRSTVPCGRLDLVQNEKTNERYYFVARGHSGAKD